VCHGLNPVGFTALYPTPDGPDGHWLDTGRNPHRLYGPYTVFTWCSIRCFACAAAPQFHRQIETCGILRV